MQTSTNDVETRFPVKKWSKSAWYNNKLCGMARRKNCSLIRDVSGGRQLSIFSARYDWFDACIIKLRLVFSSAKGVEIIGVTHLGQESLLGFSYQKVASRLRHSESGSMGTFTVERNVPFSPFAPH
jgi:hypothetical protein